MPLDRVVGIANASWCCGTEHEDGVRCVPGQGRHDHLQNIGFLYMGDNQWQLSPAFDVNPMPDKDRESKTWLSEDTGPITSMAQLIGQASRFALTAEQALAIVRQVVEAVGQWRAAGQSAGVGMTTLELDVFRLAFEHSSLADAKKLIGL